MAGLVRTPRRRVVSPAAAASVDVAALGNVQPPVFHFLHASPEGRAGGAGVAGAAGFDDFPVMASTAASMALRRSLVSSSGSPRWAHSFSVCVDAKQSSHLLLAAARPVKHIVYKVEFSTDHFVLPVIAAWRRNAVS